MKHYGECKKLIEICGRNVWTSFNQETEKAKHFKAHYYVRSRFKNNSRNRDYENTESMCLEFDTALSEDFVFTNLDFETGRSIQISVISIDQPTCGRTVLKLETQFINEEQELFVNFDYIYCETEKGTLVKRFKIFKDIFDKHCQSYNLMFLEKGFKVYQNSLIEALASHTYFTHVKKRNTFAERVIVNQILIMLSILNQDFLNCPAKIDIWNSPCHVRDSNFYKLSSGLISQEYVEQIEKLSHFLFRNEKLINTLIENSRVDGYGNNFSYAGFKEEFLKEWVKVTLD